MEQLASSSFSCINALVNKNADLVKTRLTKFHLNDKPLPLRALETMSVYPTPRIGSTKRSLFGINLNDLDYLQRTLQFAVHKYHSSEVVTATNIHLHVVKCDVIRSLFNICWVSNRSIYCVIFLRSTCCGCSS